MTECAYCGAEVPISDGGVTNDHGLDRGDVRLCAEHWDERDALDWSQAGRDPKPDDPDSASSPYAPCPGCGDGRTPLDRESETVSIEDGQQRVDYWCPACGTHVGTVVETV